VRKRVKEKNQGRKGDWGRETSQAGKAKPRGVGRKVLAGLRYSAGGTSPWNRLLQYTVVI